MSETVREVCIGCGHVISRHFNDVTGVARCLVVRRGETTSGIIGLAYEHHCDCANFKLPQSSAHAEGKGTK